MNNDYIEPGERTPPANPWLVALWVIAAGLGFLGLILFLAEIPVGLAMVGLGALVAVLAMAAAAVRWHP